MTTEAAYKAQAYRRAQFGRGDNQRTQKMAMWTRLNKDKPKCTNPFSVPNYYSEEQVFKAARFAKWQRANPTRAYSENPHGWFKAAASG
jgi:hypothetical protein